MGTIGTVWADRLSLQLNSRQLINVSNRLMFIWYTCCRIRNFKLSFVHMHVFRLFYRQFIIKKIREKFQRKKGDVEMLLTGKQSREMRCM